MDKDLARISKLLSLVLRHDPATIGLTLDASGWTDVDELIRKVNASGTELTRNVLDRVVFENDKQRFALSTDGSRIRANQGHSIDIDLGLEGIQPPDHLYHGTARHNLASILATGLVPGARQHVHLSTDAGTAERVGMRHGEPVVLVVRSAEMSATGHVFMRSANGVWLTDRVPPGFISLQESID